MRFTTTASRLRDTLTVARHGMPSGPATQVAYTGLLLEIRGSVLRATGSDGDTTITATCEVEDAGKGRILIQAGPIMTYLGNLPPATVVQVEATGKAHVSVKAGDAQPYEFRTIDAVFAAQADLPADAVSVDFTAFGDAYGAVRHAADKDGLGIQLVSTGAGLVLHSTDNYRLARAELPGAGFGEFTGSLPLPVLERIARSGVDRVYVSGKDKTFQAAGADVAISCRLLAKPFPPVEGVLDQKRPNKVNVPAEELKACLTRLASVAQDAPVACRINGDELSLEVRNTDLGNGTERVMLAEPASAPAEFLLKVAYLAEAARAQNPKEELITLGWSAPNKAVTLSSGGDMPVTCVVMPQKM